MVFQWLWNQQRSQPINPFHLNNVFPFPVFVNLHISNRKRF